MTDFVDSTNMNTVIVVAGANGSQDINPAVEVAMTWSSLTYASPGGDWSFDDAQDHIVAAFTGAAWVSFNIRLSTAVQRASPVALIHKNYGAGGARDTQLPAVAAMGYVRNASAHVFSSIYLRVLDPDVQPGDTYEVRSSQDSEAGVVNPVGAWSYFAAERVA